MHMWWPSGGKEVLPCRGTERKRLRRVHLLREHNMKEEYSVLSPKFGGGPKGLGDPNDKSLRKVEKDVLIPKLMRERTKSEKCVAEVKEFHNCCLDSGLLHVIKCREENDRMKKCMERWYYDQGFIKECTEQYLEERSEFRRTGIPKKQKNIRMEGSI